MLKQSRFGESLGGKLKGLRAEGAGLRKGAEDSLGSCLLSTYHTCLERGGAHGRCPLAGSGHHDGSQTKSDMVGFLLEESHPSSHMQNGLEAARGGTER